MAKKTVADIDVKGKRVLMRVDFNVPIDEKGNITSDNRIVMALPTIKTIVEKGGRVILMSHLGRPDGEKKLEFTMKPVAKRLSELLGKPVVFADDCIGPDVKAKAMALKDGDVLLLENVRFYKAEEIKDKKAKEDAALRKEKDDFAKQIAELGDVYVEDAFGTAHRDNASMLTVPQMMGAPEDMVLHSMVHLFMEGDPVERHRLRDLVDVRDLLAHFGGEPGFWERLVPRARQLGLERPLYYGIRYSRLILGASIPAAVSGAAECGKPLLPVRWLMDTLVPLAMLPEHPDYPRRAAALARWLMYVRSHWLRMPPLLLARHLGYKAWLRLPGVRRGVDLTQLDLKQ